jgi:uncharacterized protein
MRRLLLAGALGATGVVLVLCGASLGASSATPFSYDASQPLGFRDRGRVNKASYPVAVREVSYAVPGGRVQGYLALPPGGGRLPAVVYLPGAGGAREELLVPAVWLAGRRAVTLTITPPSTGVRAQGLTSVEKLRRDRRFTIADVVATRRAVDLLRSLPQVDPGRIGLVGWSLGARTGAILAGAEPRISAFVLMSGGATPVADFVANAPPKLRPTVRRLFGPIDSLLWIARGRPGTILLQDGREDTVVPRSALLALARAAPRDTLLRWYQAGHELNVAAYRFQLEWLSQKLGIRGPAVRGAKTGP